MPLSTATVSFPAPSVITKGVKYIKINRIDKQGNDNTLSLQELTNVRLKFDDLGIVDFPVLTINEYPDYYLYRIANVTFGNSTEKFKSPTNPTSSANTYALTAGNNTSPIFYGYTNNTGSISGTGLYYFPNGGYTVTATCYFSASATVAAKETFYVLFTGSDGIINKQIFHPYLGSPGTGSYSASISYVPTSGSTLGVAFASSSVNVNFNTPSIDFRITQDITASVDNNILNHNFSASAFTTSSLYKDPAGGITLTNTTTVPYYSTNTDTLNYYSASTPFYVLGDTPNVSLIYTASTTLEFDTAGGNGIIKAYYSRNNALSVINYSEYTSVPSSPITITVSGTFVPTENDKLFLNLGSSFGNTGFTASNIQWSITQSVSPITSSVLTVLEPYLTTDFFYDDCNALYGNDVGLEYDTDFMKVDYDGNGGNVIPSNQQQILANTAERAPVKPYNYALKAQTLPRYEGVRTTSPDFNLNTITVNTIEDCNVNSIRTGEPNVQSLGTYFAYFDWIGGTSPELISKSGIHVVYLIDKDGNVLTPTISSSYYYNLIDNFETGKNIKISLNSISNPSNIELKTVLRPGATPWGIIASQTGSGYNTQPVMYFNDPNLPDPPQYSAVYTTNQSPIGLGDTASLGLLGTTISSPEITPNFGSDYIEITGVTTNLTQIAIQLKTMLGCYQVNPSPPSPTIPTYYWFEKSSDSGATWTNIGSHTVFTTYGHPETPVDITSNFVIPQNGDWFRCTIYNPSGYFVSVTEAGNFNVIQNPLSSATSTASLSSGDYWVTGSTSKNILTGSQFFQIYQSPVVYQQNYSGSGYYDFLNFKLQYSDQVRFQGDENQVYTILDINPSGSALYLTLDRNIVDGTDLNSFLVRRYQPNPNFVTIDWDLNSYNGGGGFIFPEYATNELTQNFNDIIKNLKEKGLIPS